MPHRPEEHVVLPIPEAVREQLRQERVEHNLQWDGIAELYEQLGRQSKRDKLAELANIIQRLVAHPWDWISDWARAAAADLQEQRSAGLDLNDAESYADAARVLWELPDIQGDIPKRMLSLRLFGNSYHWGDIDLGGIQIHRFLQRHCPFPIQSLFMDGSTLVQLAEESDSDTAVHYRRKARVMLLEEAYAAWQPLLGVIAETGLKLEQEAIPDQMVEVVLSLEDLRES